MSDRTFDVSRMDSRLAKEIRIDEMNDTKDNGTAIDDNSKNMKIMDTQENSQDLLGKHAPLEKYGQSGKW